MSGVSFFMVCVYTQDIIFSLIYCGNWKRSTHSYWGVDATNKSCKLNVRWSCCCKRKINLLSNFVSRWIRATIPRDCFEISVFGGARFAGESVSQFCRDSRKKKIFPAKQRKSLSLFFSIIKENLFFGSKSKLNANSNRTKRHPIFFFCRVEEPTVFQQYLKLILLLTSPVILPHVFLFSRKEQKWAGCVRTVLTRQGRC